MATQTTYLEEKTGQKSKIQTPIEPRQELLEDLCFNNNKTDFHIHTAFSDGLNLVEDVIDTAVKNGIQEIAITDHDSTKAYDVARYIIKKEQYKNKNKIPLRIVPGVEVTVKKYHILGLYVDTKCEELQNLLAENRKVNNEKAKKRCDKLKEFGLPVVYDALREIFPLSKRISKFHIGWYIQNILTKEIEHELGLNPQLGLILGTYMTKEKMGVLVEDVMDPKRAIDAIHKANGIAIVAHPFKQINADTQMYELDRLVKLGIDGIEVQPNYGHENIPFIKYALEHNLKMTYGSDYHGPDFPLRTMLYGEDMRKIRTLPFAKVYR